MTLLQQIETGPSTKPPRVFVHGIEGIGKTTLGAQTPCPIFIQTEDGLVKLESPRFPLAKSLAEVIASLEALGIESHSFQTLVMDTLDGLERLIWDEVCRDSGVSSIDAAGGGYGRGYHLAQVHWRRVLDILTKLRDSGMGILLLSHSRVERFEDPEAPAYDRYVPRLHRLASALVVEWSDCVLFATRRFRTQTEAQGFGRERTLVRGIGPDGGDRILRCVGSPALVAKNRYGLPAEIPLSWPELYERLTTPF